MLAGIPEPLSAAHIGFRTWRRTSFPNYVRMRLERMGVYGDSLHLAVIDGSEASRRVRTLRDTKITPVMIGKSLSLNDIAVGFVLPISWRTFFSAFKDALFGEFIELFRFLAEGIEALVRANEFLAQIKIVYPIIRTSETDTLLVNKSMGFFEAL